MYLELLLTIPELFTGSLRGLDTACSMISIFSSFGLETCLVSAASASIIEVIMKLKKSNLSLSFYYKQKKLNIIE